MEFLFAFLMGGLICALAQIFTMLSKLTPPVVLVIFLVAGGFLSALGVADCLSAWGSTGFTAMIVGCGQAVYNTTLVLMQGNPVPFWTVMGVYAFLVIAGAGAGLVRSRTSRHDFREGGSGDLRQNDVRGDFLG